MICSQIRRHLEDFASGEASLRLSRIISAHLHGCAGCSAKLAEIRRMREFLAEVETVEPPADYGLAWRARIREEAARQTTAKRSLFWFVKGPAFLPALGAVALIGVCLTVFGVFQTGPASEPKTQPLLSQGAPGLMKLERSDDGAAVRPVIRYRLEVVSFGPQNKQVQKILRNYRAGRDETYFAIHERDTDLNRLTGLTREEADELRVVIEKLGAKVRLEPDGR
jgi:hypothetical protein